MANQIWNKLNKIKLLLKVSFIVECHNELKPEKEDISDRS